MTHGLYIASLLFSLAGLVLVDRKYKLAFFNHPKRAALCVGITLCTFIVWDILGIALGIFMRGDSRYSLPIQLLPQFPLEELFFLTFLCYLSLICYLAFKRLTA